MTMPNPDLRRYEGNVVVLHFADGHVVRARIIHVDLEDREEVVYDVVEVITAGRPEWSGIVPGTTAAAPLSEIARFDKSDA